MVKQIEFSKFNGLSRREGSRLMEAKENRYQTNPLHSTASVDNTQYMQAESFSRPTNRS